MMKVQDLTKIKKLEDNIIKHIRNIFRLKRKLMEPQLKI